LVHRPHFARFAGRGGDDGKLSAAGACGDLLEDYHLALSIFCAADQDQLALRMLLEIGRAGRLAAVDHARPCMSPASRAVAGTVLTLLRHGASPSDDSAAGTVPAPPPLRP